MDPQRRDDLAARIEERRRQLGARPDVSQRLRDLSASSARNIITRKRPSRPVTIALAALSTLALVACVAFSVAIISGGAWFQDALDSPSTTVENFFAAVHAQNYPEAYNFLSSKAQSELSEDRFEQDMRASDLLSGVVKTYAITTSTTHGTQATVTVDVVRKGNAKRAQVYQVTLVRESQSWRISVIKETGAAPAPTPAN